VRFAFFKILYQPDVDHLERGMDVRLQPITISCYYEIKMSVFWTEVRQDDQQIVHGSTC